jgi:hypothetical protein
MNHSPSEIIATLLVNAGKAVWDQLQATSLKWKVHVLIVPDDPPHNIVTIYDTLGLKDGRLFDTGETVVHPGWQIMVRSSHPKTGFRMADILFKHTDTVQSVQVNIPGQTVDGMLIPATNYKVVGLYKTSPIFNAGQDEKRRFLFTLNGTTTIQQL